MYIEHTCFIAIGLPKTGKTTFFNSLSTKFTDKDLIGFLSKNKIRKQYQGTEEINIETESTIYNIYISTLKNFISNNIKVIYCDDCNLTIAERDVIIKTCKKANYKIIALIFIVNDDILKNRWKVDDITFKYYKELLTKNEPDFDEGFDEIFLNKE